MRRITGGILVMRPARWLGLTARRAALALILLVPDGVRARLSQSRLLTRIYLYFDRSKYETPDSPQTVRIDQSDYRYSKPPLTPEVRQSLENLPEKPLVSLLIPVYNTRPEWLEKAIRSVERQWYPNWEICIADDASDDPATLDFLDSIDDPRIHVRRLQKNVNIAYASNAALEMARGEYVALLDHDDELTVDALYEAVRAINEHGAEFIYSDEDKLERSGRHSDPHFKPDFSPDMFLTNNYLSHFGVIKRSLVERVGGFTPGTEGAQDYDLYLKVLEITDRMHHIPKVLYHWRKVEGSTAASFSNKSYAHKAGIRALKNAIARRGLNAHVESARHPGTYRVKYEILEKPLVSVVVPFKDQPKLLRQCVRSILERSTWRHYEIIGISNKSAEPETYQQMKELAALDPRVTFYRFDEPFNFSRINNYAVANHVRGEQIILLNNDVEIISPDWIESLLEYSQRTDVGVVGARLYYPDRSVQHAGIVMGIMGLAGHIHKHFDRNHPGYFFRSHIVQNVTAVTAACCMVKRSVYDEVNGLDEKHLTVAFNDVDFCLRVFEKGYLNVYTPYCEAWHHESVSRGHETTPEKQERFNREVEYMRKRHATLLERGDPYYNPNLTLELEDFSLRPQKG